jgi:hypothetical protein
MARLVCPMCRRALPEGETHCPRCGLRIAALDRPSRRHREQAEAVGLTGAGAPSLSARDAVLYGLAGGVALVAAAAVIAWAVSRDAFATAMSNAAFFIGGSTLTLAVVLGGVRVSRLLGDVELMKRKARGEGRRAAPAQLRLGLGTAAALPLAVALALAFVAH